MAKPRERVVASSFWLLWGLLFAAVAASCVAWAESRVDSSMAGRYRLSLESTALEGDSERYRLETGKQAGWQLRQHLALRGGGSLPGGWAYDGSYDDTRPVPERLELLIHGTNAELFAGSRRFSAAAPGLLAWERLLTGVQGQVTANAAGKLRVRAAIGEPLGVPMREQLSGRGLVGPYLLNGLHVPVVEGSERVSVDGQLLQPEIDYAIDYELGAITFREPVLEDSRIDVVYEYQAAQARRTAVVAAHWDNGSFGLDLLAGNERAYGLESSPVGLPPDQSLRGAAVGWHPTPTSHLSASWLLGTTETRPQSHDVIARQLGGTWLLGQVQAGFDYRAVPSGFHSLGHLPDGADYRLFTAGYQGFLAPWHSKLNVLWRQTPMDPLACDEPVQLQLQAEHVLSYISKRGLVGWSLGMYGHQSDGRSHSGVTMGVLAQRRLGRWEVQAERRGLLACKGARAPGELLSSTQFKAQLTDDARLGAAVQWKQDRRQPGGDLPDASTVWRVKATSSASSSRAWWRVQWLQSEMVRAGRGSSESIQLSSSEVAHVRAEGQVPLAILGLSAGASVELKRRRGYDMSFHGDTAIQANTHYESNGMSVKVLAAGRSSVSRDSPVLADELQHRTSYGVEIIQPLWKNLAYQGACFAFGERDMLGEQRGVQRVHGLALTRPQWQTEITLTAGVLEQPRLDSPDPDNEGDEERSLRTVPVGHRLSWSSQYYTPHARVQMRVGRDWETEATVWRGELTGSFSVDGTQLEASFARSARRAVMGVTFEQRGRVTARWQVGAQSQLTVGGHTDVTGSPSGDGDYRASGLESAWTAFF